MCISNAVVAGLLTEPRFVDRQDSSVERQDIPSSTLFGRSGRPSVGPGGSVRSPATTELFPFAGELEGALADWLGEGLVRRDGGEPFARGLALGSQTVDQTQGLALRTQFRSPRPRVPHLHRLIVACRRESFPVCITIGRRVRRDTVRRFDLVYSTATVQSRAREFHDRDAAA